MMTQSLHLRRYIGSLVIFLSLFITNLTFGQTVKGVLFDQSGSPQPGVELHLDGTDFYAFTNGAGIFRFQNVPAGSYKLVSEDGIEIEITEFTTDGTDLDLGKIKTTKVTAIDLDNQITVISIDDLEQIEEDEAGSVSSMLTSSRDPYDRAVAFNLSVLRYRSRGYNNEDVTQYLNGMQMNDLDDGRVFWNNWGGLNDVLRVQDNDLNLRASDFTFGGLGGASMIDLRASSQRVQKKAVYSLSNRSYQHRIMYTHSTGMMQNGWAFTFAGSKRWAQSGYIDGTHYDAYSYFMSIDRKINENHTLNLVAFGAPLRRGKVGPTTQEALDLAGSNFYNPNWGYQNGDVRNAREDRVHQPIAMLRHDWSIGERTSLMTTVGYQTGKYGNTRLEWYLAPDPRPDYYRKLPSFQQSEEAIAAVTEYLTSDPANLQLDWDKMYRINKQRSLTVFNANGIEGNDVTGNLSGYVIEEQRFDTEKFSFNTILTHDFNDQLTLNGGVNYMKEITRNFKILDDLLGGEFFVDYDDFAIRDFPDNDDAKQNDLNNPDRLIYEGDKFGFNYDINTTNIGGWGQLQHVGKTVDVFISGKLEHTSFFRNGNVRTGTFPENSFGKSETKNFLTYGVKGGATYKIDGRNYLYAVASYRTRPPFSRFSFRSPRTRNTLVSNLTEEKILSGEAGYSFRFTNIKGRISGFYTDYKDQLDNASFYLDEANTFVNYIMTGVGKRHTGVEGGVEIQLPHGFSIEAAGALNQNIYTERPIAAITVDNSAQQFDNRTVYIKNYYVPGPQQAGSLTLRYNSKNYWFASLTGTIVGGNYLDFNPDRRTTRGIDVVSKEETPELWNEILAQEKLPSIFTLNFFGGKSWRVRGNYVALNVSVGNILNTKDLRTGGFEQYRFDYEGKDVDRFPPRLFYSYGRNYSINFTVAI